MSNIIKNMMLKKLKNITAEEIIHYSKAYHISVSNQQARAIADHLKKHEYDPTDAGDRAKMVKKLAQITDLKTAQACQKLFYKLIKDYHIEHLF